MKVHLTDLAIVTVLVGAACAAIYAGLSRALRHAVEEREKQMDRQINAIATTVKALQGRVAELSRLQVESAQQVENEESAAAEDTAPTATDKAPLEPETLVTLAAAATAFLGTKPRVFSVRPTATDENATAWAQQGRVIVQTSHNLRQNG